MSPPSHRPHDLRLRLPVGTVLDGSYVVEGEIGAGGFGITYRGRDMSLGHRVAIKEYFPAELGSRDSTMSVHPASGSLDPAFQWGRDGFLREAKMLAAFRHPNIVRVLRYFEANNTAYMVLEFEEGRSLGGWLASLGRKPTQAELDPIVRALADALAAIHAKRLVHRDIAPDNIIVRKDGSPVLLDFGAARYEVAEHTRQGGQSVHTTSYAIIKAHYSPIEQRSTDTTRRGPWSDIYALGATLYRAVTGKVPPDAHDRIMAERDPLLPAAAAAGEGYRPSFLAAIDRALAMKPGDRPASVAAFVALAMAEEAPSRPAAFETGETGAAPVRAATFSAIASPPVAPTRRAGGLRGAAIAAGAGVLLLGLGAMAYWVGGGGTGEQRSALVGGRAPVTAGAGQSAALVDRVAAEKAAADRITAEAAAAERATTERAARDRLAAEQAAQARAVQEKEAQERAAAERAAAAARAETERLAREAAEDERRRAEEARLKLEAEAREARAALAREQEARRSAEARVAEARKAADEAPRGAAAGTGAAATAAGLVRIERLADSYLDGEGYETTLNSTYAECEVRCLADARCVALELYKPQRKCNLYAALGPTKSSRDADVGIKRASAPEAAVGAARPLGRIVRSRNRFFEGDGYRRISGITFHACESLCLEDAQCRAIELHRKGSVCQLYRSAGKSGPTNDADIGIKQ